MKQLRDVAGRELAGALEKAFGYQVPRGIGAGRHRPGCLR